MRKHRSIYRLSVITAVATTATALMQRSVLAQSNTADIFQGTVDSNLLNSANYNLGTVPTISNDLEFGTAFPTTNYSAGTASALAVGSIDDLNTTYSVSIANNNSTAVSTTLTLGSSSLPTNSVSPVASDLVYVPTKATLNIALNSSIGALGIALGNGNLDVAGTASIQGIITGTSGLTKTGAGTLILYQANTFTNSNGPVNVNVSSGTLEIATGSALGTNTNDQNLIGAATLEFYDNSFIASYAATFTSPRSFNVSTTTSTIKVGSSTWIIGGPVIGTGVLNVVGPGTLELDNTTSGYAASYGNGAGNIATNISSGTLLIQVLKNLPQGVTYIQNGATFEYGATGSAQYSSNTTFNLSGGSDTIYIPSSTFTMFGTLSGPGSLVKSGATSLTLENTNTYTGATNLSSGATLNLDYTSSLSSNALNLGGSTGGATFNTLSLNSAAATANTLGNFNTSITTIANTNLIGGGNNINIGNFNTSSMSISLGAIARVGATSTLNVTLPSVGSVTTTSTAANFSGGQQTIIGGYVTVNGNSWAVNNGGTLTGLAAYNTSFGLSSDEDVTTNTTAAVGTVNSMRFNTASPTTLTLTAPLVVATGGILESANVAGGNATLITGGSLTSGNGSDLIVSQFNTFSPLTINSTITGSIALTKTGPGTLILSGTTSNYSGGTVINGGALGITSDAALSTVPATAATNITFAGSGATLQADAPSVTISATRSILLGALGGTFDENSDALTVTGAITGGGSMYVVNSTGASTGIFNIGPTATVATGTVLVLGNSSGGATFNVSGGRAALFNVSSTTLAGGGGTLSAGAFTAATYNFSLGAISRQVGSTVNFILPSVGHITTTTVNASLPQGQQTILGGYATVNGSTWAVSGSGATAGIISGLATYDTGFDGNSDVDVIATTPTSPSAYYINSLRFNDPNPYNISLGSPTSFSSGENAVSLYIATGGILETAAVGANADIINSGTLSSSNGVDLIVIQNNTAAPLTISSQIINFNVSGVNMGLTKAGPGTLILTTSNAYTGTTNVSGGSLVLAANNAFPAGSNLSIGALANVVVSNVSTGTYALSVNVFSNTGTLDIAGNAAILHTGTTLAAATNEARLGYNNGGWNGSSGILSSSAAANPTHLTAVGVIVNDVSGTPLYGTSGSISSTFEGSTPLDGDILAKLTYYGDTNLDGKVDGTDYARIDSGYLSAATGWFNGDFNYDGVINGSDYTLIDNAFNTQGAVFANSIAAPQAVSTAQLAQSTSTSAVPEPATLGIVAMGAIGLLGRRRRHD